MINANDYVGLTTYPDPIDYDGCGYKFGNDYCKDCEHYRECERWEVSQALNEFCR